jgi:hypothetical protein
MAKTLYTFPTQVTNSGSVVVKVYTSGGDGVSVAPTEKYFSAIRISEDTEDRGGQIKSYTADISIEDDKDLLFTNTIFPYLYEDGGYVHVQILIDDRIGYYGAIIPNSITNEAYSIDNDALDNKKQSIHFVCGWILESLRNLPMDYIYAHIVANNLYTELHAYNVPSMTVRFVTLKDLIDACFTKLNDNYAIVVSFLQNFQDYQFLTQDSSESYYYFYEGATDPSPFGVAIDDASIFGTNKIGLVAKTVAGTNGFFDVSSDKYFGTAYDFLVGLIKSFGLIPRTFYNDSRYDIVLDLSRRVSGVEAVLSDVTGHREKLFNILSSDKIDVSSNISGNKFEKFNNIHGSQSYNYTTNLDFHNDLDFNGSGYNSQYSLVVLGTYNGTLKYLALVRECAIGEDIVTNGHFETVLSPWQVGTSNFIHSPEYGGVAKTDRADSDQQLVQNLTTANLFYGNAILSCDIRCDNTDGVSVIMEGVSDGVVVLTKTVQLTLGGFSLLKFWAIYRGIKRIDRVDITIYRASYAPGNYYLDNVKLRRVREGCPELSGRIIQDYFNDKSLTIKEITINGIPPLFKYNISDYFIIEGEKYYIKKCAYDLNAYTTGLEVINYPY